MQRQKLTKNSPGVIIFLKFSKINLNFSFIIDNISITPDPDLYQDPNLLYFDPQHQFNCYLLKEGKKTCFFVCLVQHTIPSIYRGHQEALVQHREAYEEMPLHSSSQRGGQLPGRNIVFLFSSFVPMFFSVADSPGPVVSRFVSYRSNPAIESFK